jgi:ketosteroid isomerase-like protein
MLSGQIAAQQTTAPNRLQEMLLVQELKLIDAINKEDKATIQAMLADEAVSITSRGRQTTDQIIAALGRITFTGYEISDVKTYSVSPDVAILSYRFSWTGGAAGQPSETTNVYATSVWRQRDGTWRSVLYQETPVAK